MADNDASLFLFSFSFVRLKGPNDIEVFVSLYLISSFVNLK